MACIQEVPGSNHGLETGYPVGGVLSLPSDVFNGFPQPLWHTLNYGMAASFPRPYKFIHRM